jgi:transcriptional regulator with XRE-family HTH domain
MYFSSNVKFLRLRKERTQDMVATEVGLGRSTINSYENGSIKNPTLDALMLFSGYFKVSIDTLVKIDLSALSEYQLSELEKGNDTFITGSKLRVLATTVDNHNKENIEVVPIKAKAGYKNGYADPDFIKNLPTFQLPILFNDRKYRMFQVSGDSMLPIPDKSWVIGEYIENFYDIKDGLPYILLTTDEGIVFKMAYNQLRKRKNLLLKSLNAAYEPYEIDVAEVKEVWRFCNYISAEIPDAGLRKDELRTAIESIEKKIGSLKKSVEMSR